MKGLLSIPQKRGNIVRPLLDFSRREIEEYCKENSVRFVIDSSNFEENFLRNKIRHTVALKLKEIDFNFEKKFLKTIKSIALDEEYLDFLAEKELKALKVGNGLNLELFYDLHESLKFRVVFKFLKLNGVSPTNEMLKRVLKICKKKIGSEDLSKDKVASVRRGRLYVEEKYFFKYFEILLPKSIEFFYKNLYFVRCNVKDYYYFLNKTNYLFLFKIDYDRIRGDIYLRNRKQKDRIKLLNRPTKTLKALMQEGRMFKKARNDTFLLADDVGVFWAFGFGADVRVLPDKSSKNLFLIFEKL